jgi:hypothetical protein
MVAPLTLVLASLELITTDCRSPRVIMVKLAVKAALSATTSM